MGERCFQLVKNEEKRISDLKKIRNELFNIPHKHFDWKDYYSIAKIRKCQDLQEKFNLDENDLKKIVDKFISWSKKPTYLMFRNIKTGKLVAALASKRGNKIYEHLLHKKLDEQLKFMEGKEFHKKILRPKLVNGFRVNNNKISNVAFITLTCDPKKYNNNRTMAWLNFEKSYNNFINSFRKRFGKCWIMKAVESTESGYPHIHLLVITKKEFRVYKPKRRKCSNKNCKEYFSVDSQESFIRCPHCGSNVPHPYRMKLKKQINHYWGGIWDVVIPNSEQIEKKEEGSMGFIEDYIFKDMLKAYTNPKGRSYKNKLSLALGWIFGKRCYSISGAGILADLITDTSITQTQIKEKLEKLGKKEYEFIGFLDLKINSGLSPPISMEIKPDDPDYKDFLNAIYSSNPKKIIKNEEPKENVKTIIFGNDSLITQENQDLIKSIMKNHWNNILTTIKEKTLEISPSREDEIRRLNIEDLQRKNKFKKHQEFLKFDSRTIQGIIGRMQEMVDHNNNNLDNKNILWVRNGLQTIFLNEEHEKKYYKEKFKDI